LSSIAADIGCDSAKDYPRKVFACYFPVPDKQCAYCRAAYAHQKPAPAELIYRFAHGICPKAILLNEKNPTYPKAGL
jgi:hypothetical protein